MNTSIVNTFQAGPIRGAEKPGPLSSFEVPNYKKIRYTKQNKASNSGM
jgi:hypothetical protein